MSNWSNKSFNFTALDGVRAPLKSTLKVLKAAEAVLEALMDLVKPFTLSGSSNPVKPLVALLLASVRALINQVQGGGVAMLLVHPDFSRHDFNSVLESVSGGYRSFESKVVAKFNDKSDANRPAYPAGSAAAMVVFYIGASNPADLLSQLFALLSLVKHPAASFQLPAPLELKVRPVFKSDSAAAQAQGVGLKVAKLFSDNFAAGLDKKLVLEWRMPSVPPVGSSPSFANHLSTFYNAFRFTGFVIERSETPTGTPIRLPMKSTSTSTSTLSPKIVKYSMPSPDTLTDLREPGGDSFRFFEFKAPASGVSLLEGGLTGTYRFIDGDPNLESGKSYNYRVRACLGPAPTAYIAATIDSFTDGSALVKRDGNRYFLNFGQDTVVGPPSSVVRGFVPRQQSAGTAGFNPRSDVYDAVVAGLLLNFELPASSSGDTPDEIDQKAGWGSLSVAAANVGSLKAAYKDSTSIKSKAMFAFAARRVANGITSSVYDKPEMIALLDARWESGVKGTVHKVLSAEFKWALAGTVGGYNPRAASSVRAYLAKEGSYEGQFSFPVNEDPNKTDLPSASTGSLDGPYPVKPLLYRDDPVHVTVEQRNELADFLRLCLATGPQSSSYLSWYSVSIGDMFPSLVPFTFDFEQFLLSLTKAMDSILSEVEAIIQTTIDKIAQLEQFLESLNSLIDLLNVKASVSMLTYSGTNASAATLSKALMESGGKPTDSGFGLYSGLVLTTGGPGAGALQAVKALGFILGFEV